MEVKNYVLGDWIEGEGTEITFQHAINGETIGSCSSKGLDYKNILRYGREKGSTALRKMTFQQRGEMLKSLALYLHKIKKPSETIRKFQNMFINCRKNEIFQNISEHVR